MDVISTLKLQRKKNVEAIDGLENKKVDVLEEKMNLDRIVDEAEKRKEEAKILVVRLADRLTLNHKAVVPQDLEEIEEDSLIVNFKTKSDLIEVDLKSYIKYLAKNFSSKTHCRKLSSVKNFYKYLFEKKTIASNIFSNIEFPKSSKSIPKILEKNEILKIAFY